MMQDRHDHKVHVVDCCLYCVCLLCLGDHALHHDWSVSAQDPIALDVIYTPGTRQQLTKQQSGIQYSNVGFGECRVMQVQQTDVGCQMHPLSSYNSQNVTLYTALHAVSSRLLCHLRLHSNCMVFAAASQVAELWHNSELHTARYSPAAREPLQNGSVHAQVHAQQ